MGKNGNKKNTNSTNDRDFSKNGVYCNGLMLKTVFVVMILMLNSSKKILSETFGKLKYGMYQVCSGQPSIDSARTQLYIIIHLIYATECNSSVAPLDHSQGNGIIAYDVWYI